MEAAHGSTGAGRRSPLWRGRWPAEDGGPTREQIAADPAGLNLAAGERLALAAHRDAFACTMVVLRDPGEVFVLRHTMGRRPLEDESVAWVERVDPETLAPLGRSPEFAGGSFWPGGLAAHGDGSLHVVHGRYCHRLSVALEPLASRELAQPLPYNSFVVLGDGTLAMKEIDRDLRAPAHVTLLDPVTLESVCEEVTLPEPVIARLSANGDLLYVIGATTALRYRWDGRRLERDESWQLRYHGGSGRSYGWDPVLSGDQVWFLDNGAHHYATTMRGAARSTGPVRLIRVSASDCADTETIDVCGLGRGTVTDPPLYDPKRRIAVGYDSGNGVVQAFRYDDRLVPLWRAELDHAAHMVMFPATGELVMHHFRCPRFARSAVARRVGRMAAGLTQSPSVRRALSQRSADEVVVLDIETGAERARCPVPSMFQSVLFPAPGFDRDIYWVTFSTLARVKVVPA